MSDFLPIPDCRNADVIGDVLFNDAVEEPLVDVCKALGDRVRYCPVYYEKGCPGAINKCLARAGVVERLVRATELLETGYSFLIFDAWRPYVVQRKLYDDYLASLKVRPEYSNLSHKELETVAKQFVSIPSRNPKRPYVHGTGGAIDLTILDDSGMMLNMGTAFDDFSPKAYTSYFEHCSDVDALVKENRRMLYHVMTQSGFINLPSEWWHYDYGDHLWALQSHKLPFYKVIYS